MKKPTIGFIGLGVMGTPMAGNLAKAGYPLAVYDKKANLAHRLSIEFEQVRAVESPKLVAEFSDIVITMLPTGNHVREVIRSRDGLIEGYRPGSLHLDTSSAEPWVTLESARFLEEHGVAMVDAPVSGAEPGARQAELVFMVGGNQKDVSRVTPLLQVMGKQQFHLGPIGSGHTMKCVNNLITAICFMATTEGLIIGKRLGLDPHTMNDVLNASTGMSWNSINHFKQHIFNRKFDDHFKLGLMIKDIGIAMKLAGDQGLSPPLCESVHMVTSPLLRKLANSQCRSESGSASQSEFDASKTDDIDSDSEPTEIRCCILKHLRVRRLVRRSRRRRRKRQAKAHEGLLSIRSQILKLVA